MIDEYNYYYPNHTYLYGNKLIVLNNNNNNIIIIIMIMIIGDGPFWDVHQKEAEWPYAYNHLMSGLVSLFGDVILDAYSVSKDMLKFVNYQERYYRDNHRDNNESYVRPQIHADALHYCAGGMTRALLLPLSDIIEHHINCRGHYWTNSNSHNNDTDILS